jgi:bifunctional enzyme CysN/CysC
VIDRLSNHTVGAGMILDHSTSEEGAGHWDDAPQSERLHTERGNVTAEHRAARFGQKPCTVLLTGLSGAGKSTTAYALERRLFDDGRAVTVLDGQNMRLGISRDLGFTAADRSENLRRSAEVAKLINDAGMVCVCAFASPSEEVRQRAAEVVGADRFVVVHLSAPLEVCRERDREGLYSAADAGDIADFPGVSSPYEVPAAAALTLNTAEDSVATCVDQIVQLLKQREFI